MSDVRPLPAAWPVMSIDEAHARLTAPGMFFEMEEREIRGIATRTWKNGPHTLRDLFVYATETFAGRDFLVYEDDRVTYDAFARAVENLAQALVGMGVEKGDRVAIVMRNLPEWPVAFFAGLVTGAIVTPLNAWWTGSELEYGLTDSGAKIAIVDPERLQRLAPHIANCPDLQRVIVARAAEESAHPAVSDLEDILGPISGWADLEKRPLPAVEIDPEDDASIFYTSGTTGNPKGALGTHRNMASNVLTQILSLFRTYLRRGEAPPPTGPEAPQKGGLVSIPFFHVTGASAMLGPGMAAGSKFVLMRKWDPELAMALIEREKLTSAGGVPTIAWQLIEHPARSKYDLSSLESLSYGGAPSASELVRKITGVSARSQPGNGWGMTETSATVTHHQAEDYVNRPDSAGPASPVCDIKVTGPDGEARAPGEIGELWAKGPNILKAYWNKPKATAETFIDGWVRTGDLAYIDAEGFCFIVDRAKDMIIRGGENIYSAEVENVLYEHPDVLDAALVPIPHRSLGEEPAAVVTLKRGSEATEADLRAWVADRLAAFKVPVKVLIRHELLPRNANGKILKAELKALFA